MHILYLDESGGPNSWNAQKNFVLGGVAIHEGQIYTLTKAMNDLQEKYFPGIEIPIEFHAYPIREGKGPHFNHFSQTERNEILDDVYNILHKSYFPNVIAFATCINISAVTGPTQVTYDCFKDVCQNFNLFLYHQYKKGNLNKGMLIIDRVRDKQYLDIFNEFKQSPDVQTYLANIVDIPYFGASKETRMLQLADFVANAVFRYYESGDSSFIDKVMPRFYRGPKYHPTRGLNHITKESTCTCYACS